MGYIVSSYKNIEGKVEMPILKPIRINTNGLSWWKKTKKYFKAREWEVVEDYKLYVPWLDKTILIPNGYVFDAASIPRFLWPLLNPTGILLIPALVHDFGYEFSGFLNTNREKIYTEKEYSRDFFDVLFRDLGIYVNGINSIPNIAYKALKLFGRFSWGNYRKISNRIEDFFEVASSEQAYCDHQEIF